ncbi:hypothetical protein EV368DRAFT_68842 [Lentinula lateritia]|nr:hypothetical protein EV368DRAFT_68842 [Lentinula lateritia]
MLPNDITYGTQVFSCNCSECLTGVLLPDSGGGISSYQLPIQFPHQSIPSPSRSSPLIQQKLPKFQVIHIVVRDVQWWIGIICTANTLTVGSNGKYDLSSSVQADPTTMVWNKEDSEWQLSMAVYEELAVFFAGQDDVHVSLDGAILFNPNWATKGHMYLEDASKAKPTAATLNDDDDETGGFSSKAKQHSYSCCFLLSEEVVLDLTVVEEQSYYKVPPTYVNLMAKDFLRRGKQKFASLPPEHPMFVDLTKTGSPILNVSEHCCRGTFGVWDLRRSLPASQFCVVTMSYTSLKPKVTATTSLKAHPASTTSLKPNLTPATSLKPKPTSATSLCWGYSYQYISHVAAYSYTSVASQSTEIMRLVL